MAEQNKNNCVKKKWIEKQTSRTGRRQLSGRYDWSGEHFSAQILLWTQHFKKLQVIAKGDHVIAMDEHGMDITTLHMSKTMANWRLLGKNIALIIGGANGLDQSILQMANEIWRLSSLTLPHAMARLLLIEQLYRSYTILENHPYHRE